MTKLNDEWSVQWKVENEWSRRMDKRNNFLKELKHSSNSFVFIKIIFSFLLYSKVPPLRNHFTGEWGHSGRTIGDKNNFLEGRTLLYCIVLLRWYLGKEYLSKCPGHKTSLWKNLMKPIRNRQETLSTLKKARKTIYCSKFLLVES